MSKRGHQRKKSGREEAVYRREEPPAGVAPKEGRQRKGKKGDEQQRYIEERGPPAGVVPKKEGRLRNNRKKKWRKRAEAGDRHS